MTDAVRVHPTAVVGEGVELGEGTRVWHFCHVMSGARFGRGCVLGQNGFVAGSVVIGDGCRIQNNVSLYDGVTLGDRVFVGPSAVFTNVTRPRAGFPRRDAFEHTVVEDDASIGANATIVCGVRIGRGAMVGAGAVVTRDVPAFAVVVGAPARPSGWVCLCGEALEGDGLRFDDGACRSCDRRYRYAGPGLETT